jgi:F-type H+-transporting ATPase subunit c
MAGRHLLPFAPNISQEFKMDPVAAKFLGAGLACLGMGLAAMGVGNIFGNFVAGALRNPSAAASQFTNAIVGAALAEGLGIFALVVALVLLFVV